MFLLQFFAVLLYNRVSFCHGSIKDRDIVSHQLLNFGSKTTVATTRDLHGDLVDTLIQNAGNIFGEWDYTETSGEKILHYDTEEDKEVDVRNLGKIHILQKQMKDYLTPLRDRDVSGFAARPYRNEASTVPSITKRTSPFSPKPLFPMTGPRSTLLIYHARRNNHSLTVESCNVSNTLTNPYRSCISCNNLENANCDDPRDGRVDKIVDCQDKDDVCYSQHTPFGVVNRGCYNARNNITTYVCACNLCNLIPITEMPYIFKTKEDWAKNVIELSRLNYLTKSVFKDMRCLQCVVNGTTKSLVNDSDMLEEVNCLSPSNIESMKTEQCREDFICGVIAKASEHYIWRGCVQAPLYNYWLQTCDKNLCNHDPIVSVYT